MEPGHGGAAASRDLGVDAARGLAVLFMIQTHGYDGWLSAAGRESWAYPVIRVLSGVAAPLFLFLAGVGMGLMLSGAAPEQMAKRRRRLMRRGLEVVGYGYLVSLCYAAIEGSFRMAELLRADILHCIGLSIILCAYLLAGRRHLAARATLLVAAALLIGFAGNRHLPGVPDYLGVPLGLLIDVHPYTRFPLFPLCGFTALGLCAGRLLSRGAGRLTPWRCLTGLLVALMLAVLFTLLTIWTVARLGGSLSRGHPAVVFNLMNGAARSGAVLLGGLLWARLHVRGGPLFGAIVHLGRHSLFAYAFHIPFCYGRVPRGLGVSGQLDLAPSTLALLALMLLTYGATQVSASVRGWAGAVRRR